MHPSSSISTGNMRYVMAFMGCIGVTLINFCKENHDFFHSPYYPELAMEVVYWMTFIQLPIPVAILAERISAKRLIIATLLIKTLSVFLLRTRDPTFFKFVVFGKVLQAYADASYLPIMHMFIARWAPPNERSLIASIIYSGISIGEMLTSLGLYAYFYFETIATFYFIGTLSFMWILAWCILIEDTPEVQTDFISEKEKKFILKSLKKSESEHLQKHYAFPFRAVFTSKPFWALLVAHCCIEGGITFVQHFPVKKDWLALGFLRGVNFLWLPYLSMTISMLIIGYLMTLHLKNGRLTLTQTRRIPTLFAAITMMIPMQMTCTSNEEVLFALRVVGFMFYGPVYSGCMINHIDLAPRFAATLVSITMTAAGLVRILITYYLVYHLEDKQLYPRQLPYVTGIVVVFITGILIYFRYCSTEEQSWNKDPSRCGSKKGDAGHETLLPTPV